MCGQWIISFSYNNNARHTFTVRARTPSNVHAARVACIGADKCFMAKVYVACMSYIPLYMMNIRMHVYTRLI